MSGLYPTNSRLLATYSAGCSVRKLRKPEVLVGWLVGRLVSWLVGWSHGSCPSAVCKPLRPGLNRGGLDFSCFCRIHRLVWSGEFGFFTWFGCRGWLRWSVCLVGSVGFICVVGFVGLIDFV